MLIIICPGKNQLNLTFNWFCVIIALINEGVLLMKNVKNLRVNKKLLALTLMGAMAVTSLTGCYSTEMAPIEKYDVVGQDAIIEDNELLSKGLLQVLDVPGEKFKLKTQYTCDEHGDREWRVTSDKFLYLKVNTDGLAEDTEVYIDNIHIDTSIKSKYAVMDGIIQDTMDDRVHNAQMIGFPISDDKYYYGVNAIEGSNQQFIQGTFYGYNGYSTGTVEQQRRTESEYVGKFGVYANKFQIVYDLLVQGPNDKTPRNISVNTDFIVPVTAAKENMPAETVKEKVK